MNQGPTATFPAWTNWAIILSPVVTALLTTLLTAIVKPKYEDFVVHKRETRARRREADGRLFWLFYQEVSKPLLELAIDKTSNPYSHVRQSLARPEWSQFIDHRATRLFGLFLTTARPWREAIAKGTQTASGWSIAMPAVSQELQKRHDAFVRYMRAYVGEPEQYNPERQAPVRSA